MTNIFQFLEIFFGYVGAYSTKKQNIFIFYVISTIFSLLMFWSIGNTAAILPILTMGIRYFIFIFKDKYKTELPLYFCLFLHFGALVFSTKMLLDMVPSVLVILGCLMYWYLDEEKLKGVSALLNIPWIIYYGVFGLYLSTVNATIHIFLEGFAYLKIKSQKKKLECYD